jgi:clan AA aspartic protease (TIGR02281 family)
MSTDTATQRLERLLDALQGARTLLIVLQDFPDPDAVGAAVALREIANQQCNVTCTLACSGLVGRAENRALVRYLDVNLQRVSDLDPGRFDAIAMVDTQPGHGNNSLPDDVVPDIVIDHHPIRPLTRRSPFHDIRKKYGASSSMLFEYLHEADIVPDVKLATALVYGIRSDTGELGRDATQADVDAFLALYPSANKRMLGRIAMARLPRDYFQVLWEALRQARTYRHAVVSGLGEIDNPDIIGEVADLLLRDEESTWAACFGYCGDRMYISIRTSEANAQADQIMRRIVGRRGSGGGHDTMGGGQIPLRSSRQSEVQTLERTITQRFLRAIGLEKSRSRRLVTSTAAVVVALTTLCTLPEPVMGDVIRLKNGQTIEGIITQETDTAVVLSLGVGSMTLRRSQIADISRSSEAATQRLTQEWKKRYYLHPKHVPPDLKSLADAFRNVEAVRRQARQAHGRIAREAKLAERRDREILELQQKRLSISTQLRATRIENVRAYNVLVAEINATNAKLALKHGEHKKTEPVVKKAQKQISVYLDTCAAFEQALKKEHVAYLKGQRDEQRDHFFHQLAGAFEGIRKDFTDTEVPALTHGGNTIVTVRINDKRSGKFILDTGASAVTITAAFAKELDLDITQAPRTRISLADGSTLEAPRIKLATIQVGKARAENIDAIVMPASPGQQLDGLLGMSFLKHFVVRLDGDSGNLVLRAYHPQ